MSSPAGPPTDYDLPDELPAHLEEHVQGAAGLKTTNEWLVSRKHALKSFKTGKQCSFYLLHTRERLHAQFYACSKDTCNKDLGVLVVNGPSFDRPVIIGRSPSAKTSHYRVWRGPNLSFAEEKWEILKTTGQLSSEVKRLEDWDKDDDDQDDSNLINQVAKSEHENIVQRITNEKEDKPAGKPTPFIELLRPRRSTSIQAGAVTQEGLVRKRRASNSPARHIPTHNSIVVVQFISDEGSVLRQRAWSDCNSVNKLFAQAVVGRLLSAREEGSTLAARVAGQEHLLIKGDEADFEALDLAVGNAVAAKENLGEEGVVDIEVRQLDT